jgi:hypothetical protein
VSLLVNQNELATHGVKTFRGLGLALLFLLDFRVQLGAFYFDLLPDFLGWIIAAWTLRRTPPLHSSFPRMRGQITWLVILTWLHFLVEVTGWQLVGWQVGALLVAWGLDLIILGLEIGFVWHLCEVVMDIATENQNTLLWNRAEVRRKLFIIFRVMQWIALGLVFFLSGAAPVAIAVVNLAPLVAVGLLLDLTLATAHSCKTVGNQQRVVD